MPPRIRVYYYRTAGGSEIHLVLEFGVNERWAIEIKKGTSFTLGRGYHEACADLKPQKKFLIYAGEDKFPSQNAVTTIGLYDFMEILKEKRCIG